MQLRPVPKWGRGSSWTAAPADTLRRAWPLARRLGVTRLADITGLDRLGIPVWSAVVPSSPDVISVYNGKGASHLAARTGALMEAIERQCALRPGLPTVRGSYAGLAARAPVLDPRRVTWPLAADYDEAREHHWVKAWDLAHERPVLVPATLAGYLCDARWPPAVYAATATHGLAAGNGPEEAVCSALCEIIERDTFTLAELLAHWRPLARRELAAEPRAGPGADDLEAWPCLDLASAPPPVPRLLEAFARAGLSPVVRDITCGVGVPTVVAAVADESAHGAPQAHFGAGTHPNAAVAVTRALTELAQSRAADIHAVREDIVEADDVSAPGVAHTRRVAGINRSSWFHAPSRRTRPFAQMASREHDDVLEDVRWLVARLRDAGLGEVLAVDLSPADRTVAVVRVIVPGAETWGLDRTRLGERAAVWWRRHA
jgi:ribosomal protein S12 methylthiotransferase accessory factor YcaO